MNRSGDGEATHKARAENVTVVSWGDRWHPVCGRACGEFAAWHTSGGIDTRTWPITTCLHCLGCSALVDIPSGPCAEHGGELCPAARWDHTVVAAEFAAAAPAADDAAWARAEHAARAAAANGVVADGETLARLAGA